MRTKHTFRLPPELARQLADYAGRKRLHQAFVVETALTSFLSPDNSERMEAALGKRLDRLTRQVERLERHVTISNEAIALFVHRIVREIGSLAAALGGLDGLVFTAGIGENDSATRAEVAAGCAWLGLKLDPIRNATGRGNISAEGSAVQTWVVPTDEERMITRHVVEVLQLRVS